MLEIKSITIDRNITPVYRLGRRSPSEYVDGTSIVNGEFQCGIDDLYLDDAVSHKFKYRPEYKFTRKLGDIFGISLYYRMNTNGDSIILDGWNEKLDFISDFKLYRMTLDDTIYTTIVFMMGDISELEALIKTLENMEEYNKVQTIDEILNNFMIEELKK